MVKIHIIYLIKKKKMDQIVFKTPLLGGRKSKKVYLLQLKGGSKIVKKIYDFKNRRHVRHFMIETTILKHLLGCPFVPQVLKINKKKYHI